MQEKKINLHGIFFCTTFAPLFDKQGTTCRVAFGLKVTHI